MDMVHMEDKKNDAGKVVDDMILPGFRFHPTDEELVGFYLTRKAHQRPFPIELIKQVDIYKYDPWDLPKLASTGEKEWYFYSSRDRKYRNSTRPNRVTRSGFWKATGTDRPIYSSEGSTCIGLKKSLVFYRGKAAKGSKTDWMMHEFRLPPLPPGSTPMPRKSSDKSLSSGHLNDSWAICRIFKKAKTMAQRGVPSVSWEPSSPAATMEGDKFSPPGAQLCCPPTSTAAFTSPLDFPASSSSYHHKNMNVPPTTPTCSITSRFSHPARDFVSTTTTSSSSGTFFQPQHLFNGLSTGEGGEVPPQQFSGGISGSLLQGIMQGKIENSWEKDCYLRKMNNPYCVGQPQWRSTTAGSSVGFGLGLPCISSIAPDLPWDSSPHLSEMSTSYSSN